MLRSSNSLLVIFVGCVAAAGVFYWLGLAESGLTYFLHHEGLEGDKLKEHVLHTGLFKAIATYLGIAFTVMSFVALPFFLLTKFKYDNEPEMSGTAAHH